MFSTANILHLFVNSAGRQVSVEAGVLGLEMQGCGQLGVAQESSVLLALSWRL